MLWLDNKTNWDPSIECIDNGKTFVCVQQTDYTEKLLNLFIDSEFFCILIKDATFPTIIMIYKYKYSNLCIGIWFYSGKYNIFHEVNQSQAAM